MRSPRRLRSRKSGTVKRSGVLPGAFSPLASSAITSTLFLHHILQCIEQSVNPFPTFSGDMRAIRSPTGSQSMFRMRAVFHLPVVPAFTVPPESFTARQKVADFTRRHQDRFKD